MILSDQLNKYVYDRLIHLIFYINYGIQRCVQKDTQYCNPCFPLWEEFIKIFYRRGIHYYKVLNNLITLIKTLK